MVSGVVFYYDAVMPLVVVRLRDREMTRKEMRHTRITIGRDHSCDVVIDNAGVSRNHALIVYMDDEFRVRDDGSQNGIFVNGKKVRESILEYGDIVGIGKFEVELIETDRMPEDLKAGSAKKKGGAPQNVMGTMQMDAGAVAKMREQIMAQKHAAPDDGDDDGYSSDDDGYDDDDDDDGYNDGPEDGPAPKRKKRRKKAPKRRRRPPPRQPSAPLPVAATRSRESKGVPTWVWLLIIAGLVGLLLLKL